MQVLVISGETGCGKTTQLPQYILEEEIARLCGAHCSIICTQPRRISAISVAARISSERGENLGETVGYQIRLEAKRSDQTRLLFCTTGILLRQLVIFVTCASSTFMRLIYCLILPRGFSSCLAFKIPQFGNCLVSQALTLCLFVNLMVQLYRPPCIGVESAIL